ncbi:thioredoxin-disulfide reductase [Methyloligella sp. GL2]|nr:thioredoxin-disulfide reductase [Methyloligella sp. GL2]
MYRNLIILGSGPAGWTAAIYAARAGLAPLLLTGMEPGGQLTITTDVENYPGYADPIQGPWLMEQMQEQAKRMGTEVVTDLVTRVALSQRPFRLTGDSGREYTADALIIATGAKAKWLDLPSEAKFQGFGVSACATCDGFFYRNRTVVVVGGGNTAVEEALFLAGIADKVILVHRRDRLRAEKVMQDRLLAHPKLEVIWNAEIAEIVGTEAPRGVTGVVLRDTRDGAVRKIATDGVFIAIGHSPATEVFAGQLPTNDGGYLDTAPNSTATAVPGVFAAGDVADDQFRQAVTAAGQGCMAALEADRYLVSLALEATAGNAQSASA